MAFFVSQLVDSASEDLVASCVNKRIDTWVDETDHRAYVELLQSQYLDLFEI